MCPVLWPYNNHNNNGPMPPTSYDVAKAKIDLRQDLMQNRALEYENRSDIVLELEDLKEDFEEDIEHALKKEHRIERKWKYLKSTHRALVLAQNQLKSADQLKDLALNTRDAFGILNNTKKYSPLKIDQIYQMYAALRSLLFLADSHASSPVNLFDSGEKILDLAMEYFYPTNIHVKKNESFLRVPPDHAILSGHGFFISDLDRFRVPSNVQIHFYSNHGAVQLDEVGQSIEGIGDGHVLAIPLEIKYPGELVENHFLAYPGGTLNALSINVKGRSEGINDMVINRNPYVMISLRELVETDVKCKAARFIHWCACRSDGIGLLEKGWEYSSDVKHNRASSHPRLILRNDRRTNGVVKGNAGGTPIEFVGV